MLANLIKTLFGQATPQEMLEQRLKTYWQQWLQPISADNPVGEDLSYDDDFQYLKDEVAKLSGIDALAVAQTSEQLLMNQSKDIRVASYYAWARLRLEGGGGLADGLELIAGLITHYDLSLHPKRPESRKIALEWLANNKFVDLLEAGTVMAQADMQRAIASLSHIIQLTAMWPDKQQPDLQRLVHFFHSQLEQPEPVTLSSTTSTSSTTESAPVVMVANNSQLRSLRDTLDQARQMAQFLREQPEGLLPAMRLLRTIRWDTVTILPAHDEKGYTRLHPPRSELRLHLNRLRLQKQWVELLEHTERAFAEAANHFWFDLQRHASEALTHAGIPYSLWQDTCATDVALMLDRLKGIERLRYSDGTPFADDETLHWLTNSATFRHLDEGAALAAMPIEIDGTTDWQEIELQAIEIVEREGLESAFIWLQSLPGMVTDKQRYLQRFLLARVAEQSGEREVAVRLLTPLNQDLTHYRLCDWEPELVFDVKTRLFKLLQHKMLLKDVDKSEVSKQLDELLKQLTVLNPARALTL